MRQGFPQCVCRKLTIFILVLHRPEEGRLAWIVRFGVVNPEDGPLQLLLGHWQISGLVRLRSDRSLDTTSREIPVGGNGLIAEAPDLTGVGSSHTHGKQRYGYDKDHPQDEETEIALVSIRFSFHRLIYAFALKFFVFIVPLS